MVDIYLMALTDVWKSLAEESAYFQKHTEWKMLKYGVFSGPYFLYLDWIRRFTTNTGKYGPGKISYLDTFYVVITAYPLCHFRIRW